MQLDARGCWRFTWLQLGLSNPRSIQTLYNSRITLNPKNLLPIIVASIFFSVIPISYNIMSRNHSRTSPQTPGTPELVASGGKASFRPMLFPIILISIWYDIHPNDLFKFSGPYAFCKSSSSLTTDINKGSTGDSKRLADPVNCDVRA